MIFSSQSTFGDKFSIALPTNTADHSSFLPNDIDLGASMIPVHGKKVLGRDIGGGTPIPIVFMINKITTNVKLNLYFNIWTSDLPDSGYNPILESIISNSSIEAKEGEIAGVRYMVLNAKRYLRVRVDWKALAAPPANSVLVVTAALGTVGESYEELM